jgi:hypothetical protein
MYNEWSLKYMVCDRMSTLEEQIIQQISLKSKKRGLSWKNKIESI